MTNIVQLRRDVDTRPCDTEFAPAIDTRYLSVHVLNAGPQSALDGHTPRTARMTAGQIGLRLFFGVVLVGMAACYVRWALQ